MSYPIFVYPATEPEVKQLNAFCESRSIFLGKNREFIVEVKELPEVFSELKFIGFKDAKENNWMLGNISDAGITLLINNITNPDAPSVQATIFIPKENIICIHSLTEEFINGLKESLLLT